MVQSELKFKVYATIQLNREVYGINQFNGKSLRHYSI